MARFTIPNLAHIRGQDDKLYSALNAIQDAIGNLSDQSNASATGAANAAPDPISKLTVSEKNGIHDISIQDDSPAYRGKEYFAEYSDSPDFSNAHQISLGTSQNYRANLGSGKYYWRASSAYPTSDSSPHVYHGGAQPTAAGSGDYTGPAMSSRQGVTGYGPIYRNSPTPPIRK